MAGAPIRSSANYASRQCENWPILALLTDELNFRRRGGAVMSTAERHERNNRRQRRWYAKHRALVRERRQVKKLHSVKIDGRCLRAGFRTFGLGDPRGVPDFVPRFIGYCPAVRRPVWSERWALRNLSHAR